MAGYDTVQEGAGRAEEVMGRSPTDTFRFFATSKSVTPLDKKSKEMLDAIKSGVGLNAGDQAQILGEVSGSHVEQMDGGTAITIEPKAKQKVAALAL